ncbi:unnamed protein product [Caenorhabditis angaria]|uniref:Uncharacterized protein n=1 Tax=Caenorhabditis angaria TaxID=860376 RepID=A0A9P1ILA2_9PELO|nr:unnamed protein product [Caenorhabditis angaria]
MDELSKNLEKYQWRLEMRKKTWENTVSNINNSNNFMLNYQPQNPNQNYFPQENIHLIEHQIKIIETEAEKSMRNLENNESIQKLEAHFEYLKQKFEFADNDMELKERNQNTYGSTKSRAKSEMEKSKMMLKLEKIQVELEIYENFKEKIEEIKGFSKSRFMEYIYVKNINLREKFRMGRGDFDKFDQIMAFFELPDPL